MKTPLLQNSSAGKKSVDSHYLFQQISRFFLLPFLTLPNTNTNALLCILTKDKSDVVLFKKKKMERLRQFTAILMQSLQSMTGDR